MEARGARKATGRDIDRAVMVDVGAVSEFEDRHFRIVTAGGHEIGVLRWSDRFFAVHNRCPHQKGPVCLGLLSGRLGSSSPGSMELDDATPVLACPWHGWEFELDSGRAVWDPGYAVKTVPVKLEGGRVLLELGRRRGSDEAGAPAG